MARLMESLTRRARQPPCAFDIGTDISRHALPRARRLGAGDLGLAGGQPHNAQVLRPALPGHLLRSCVGLQAVADLKADRAQARHQLQRHCHRPPSVQGVWSWRPALDSGCFHPSAEECR